MVPKIIKIGPLSLHAYGLLIAIGIFTAYLVAKKRAHIYKINVDVFDRWTLIIPLVAAIIGARIYHVLDYWQQYTTNPIGIIQIQNGGLGIWGALLGAFLGFFLLSRIEKINFYSVLDLAAPSVVLGQAIGRIGNWINQEGFGPPTNLPWKVYIDVESRPDNYLSYGYFHPTFFYEAVLNLCIFTTLICLTKRFTRPGQVFALYLIFYGTLRFFLEFYRIDTWQFGQVKVAQLISIASIAIGLFLLKRRANILSHEK